MTGQRDSATEGDETTGGTTPGTKAPGDAIVVENVHKTYEQVTALNGVSTTFEQGRYHGLLGPNGSGKSTLLRLVLELARPDEGTVHRPEAVLGCSFQQPKFYPDLSVQENIDVFTSMAGTDNETWRETVLDELRLTDGLGRKGSELSGGYARKLDLALALVKEPDFLFLDEPLGALDGISKTQLLEFLEEYTGMGNTVVVSSHYVETFAPHLEYLTLLHDGEVLVDKPRDEIGLGEASSLRRYYLERVRDTGGGSVEDSDIG